MPPSQSKPLESQEDKEDVEEKQQPRMETTIEYTCAEAMIQQLLAVVFLFAFGGAWYQNEGLMGDYGLQPARTLYWEPLQEQQYHDNAWQGFLKVPSIFWFLPLSDQTMYCIIFMGLLLSTLVLATGRTTWLWQFILWILYFSIVSTANATSFYSYGWESQLLETAFLSIFLCPVPGFYQGKPYLGVWPTTISSSSTIPPPHGPTAIPRWLFRWLIFRITLGAGLIKLRGSSCWAHRTCLYYHFETQPIPSPLSFLYHFLSREMHRRMIDFDLIVQVYTCWFVLVPPWGTMGKWILRTGGFLQIGLMLAIIASGNFAFLNHLTIVPALACLDDGCWPKWLCQRIYQNRIYQNRTSTTNNTGTVPPLWRSALDVTLLCVIAYLSWPVVSNLWGGSGQIMNGSFDNFRLVNTYGAFGSVGEARYEPIISVSDNMVNHSDWMELEFPCKPGNVHRRPCFCAPYHHRLDWNIWFIGFKPHKHMLHRRENWLFSLLAKLLIVDKNPRPWLNLLDSDSARFLREGFYDLGKAPKYVKVDMYHYRMAYSLGERLLGTETMVWWNRTFTEPLIPPVQWNSEQQRLQHANLDG